MSAEARIGGAPHLEGGDPDVGAGRTTVWDEQQPQPKARHTDAHRPQHGAALMLGSPGAPQRASKRGSAGPAVTDLPGQRTAQHGDEAPRHAGPVVRHVGWEHLPPSARKGFVQHHADRVQVRVRADVLAERLLRRHVPRRARGPQLAAPGRGLRTRFHRDAEIAEQRAVPFDEDVVGLDVAMHDVEAVDRLQRVEHVSAQLHHLVGCQRAP